MDITIYRDNSVLKQALAGYAGRVAQSARRDGIKISVNTLRRHCQTFRAEIGASFWAKSKAVVFYLARIDRARADLLVADLFSMLPERKKLWRRAQWLDEVFQLIGRLQALAVHGDFVGMRLAGFGLAAVLTEEFE